MKVLLGDLIITAFVVSVIFCITQEGYRKVRAHMQRSPAQPTVASTREK